MRMMIRSVVLSMLLCGAASPAFAFVEPVLADYTAYPIFTVNPVPPNILIMLDNSGSMNFNAYGTWPGDSGTVTDRLFNDGAGYPQIDMRISVSADDIEESSAGGYLDNGDLDLGGFAAGAGQDTIVGLRFTNLLIPQAATIVSAKIEFSAKVDGNGNDQDLTLEISGQDTDNAQAFENETHSVSGRTMTTARVNWAITDGLWNVASEAKTTSELKTIVQEIVDRAEWSKGNSIVFALKWTATDPKTGKRDVYPRNFSSADAPKLILELKYPQEKQNGYYGYFNSSWFYYYGNGQSFYHALKKLGYQTNGCAEWEVDAAVNPESVTLTDGDAGHKCLSSDDIRTSELWDGNWMNWAASRRTDIIKQIMTGGKATSRTGGGNQTNIFEDPAQSGRIFYRIFDSTGGPAVTPYQGLAGDQTIKYGFAGGKIEIDTDDDGSTTDNKGSVDFTLQVKKNITYEPEDFVDGNIAGVLQAVTKLAEGGVTGDVYWGREEFNTGTGNNQEGGSIVTRVGDQMTNLITGIGNISSDTWTPLAESFYVATQYFKQEAADTDLGYANGAAGSLNNTFDPFYQTYKGKNQFIPCAKSFVLMLTDGASTKDRQVPSTIMTSECVVAATSTECETEEWTACTTAACTATETIYVCADQSHSCSITKQDVNRNYKDYDNDSHDPGSFGSDGTDYLDDLALYARTNDLRSDLEDEQNLYLYTVYAFGNDPMARQLLMDAAKNGGFDDTNGNKVPDLSDEWDKNGDNVPDAYFEAQDGYVLKTKILDAIIGMLDKASAGTAVSVLATSSEGEGNLVQAYFEPVNSENEVKWPGYLQSLWVDGKGNLREDTKDHSDTVLDLSGDKVIEFFVEGGDAKVRKFPTDKIHCKTIDSDKTDNEACDGIIAINTDWLIGTGSSVDPSFIQGYYNENGTVNATNSGVCVCYTDIYPTIDDDTRKGADVTVVKLHEIVPIWEAGRLLADIADVDNATTGRKIFTSLDDESGVVARFGGVDFTTANFDKIQPYLGVKNSTSWGYLGTHATDADLGHSYRSKNLISYVRGVNGNDASMLGAPKLRKREMDLNGNDADGKEATWRLGDIVHSTPVLLSEPPDRFDFVYANRDFNAFKIKQLEQGPMSVVYVGANDGMLHAFSSGFYNSAEKKFYKGFNVATGTYSDTGVEIGSELWAYIPKPLLPHLKWLPMSEKNATPYTHVYYVDLKPKIFNAQIFLTTPGDPSTEIDTLHKNGWGTVLIGGLRMGGKAIPVEGDFDYDGTTADTEQTFTASYFCIDITDPMNPVVLWDRSFDGMNLTTLRPAAIKVNEKWFAVLGSGPEGYTGRSSESGKVYVVDLLTGNPNTPDADDWLFETTTDATKGAGFDEDDSVLAGAASLDKGLNFSVDSIYMGSAYLDSDDFKGSMYRIGNIWQCGGTGCLTYGQGPNVGDNATNYSGYNDDPTTWKMSRLFATNCPANEDCPITGEPAIAADFHDNIFVYFGTGRYIEEADKGIQYVKVAGVDVAVEQHLYGIKDPFFNQDRESGEDLGGGYYMDPNNPLTLQPTGNPHESTDPALIGDAVGQENIDDLFDADDYKVIWPWGTYTAPAGSCASVPTGAVGDIFGDGSCSGAYVWPEYVVAPLYSQAYCDAELLAGQPWAATPVIPGCGSFVDQGGGVYTGTVNEPTHDQAYCDAELAKCDSGDGSGDPCWAGVPSITDCSSEAYDMPTWGCVPGTGTCDGILPGVVHEDANYHALYWRCSEVTEGSCTGVPFGDDFNNGDCVCAEVDVSGLGYTATARPYVPCDTIKCSDLGTLTKSCELVNPVDYSTTDAVNPGDSGDILENGGSCYAGYWACTETVDDGCKTVNYTLQTGNNPGFLGTAEDGDYFDNGECICQFVTEPVAIVVDITGNVGVEFNEIIRRARLHDGWVRTLPDPGERSVTKPAVTGGLTLFSTFVPGVDVCSFGGESYLYALYFESGTAFKDTIFVPGIEIGDNTEALEMMDRISLGRGMASQPAIHAGRQDKDKISAFIEQSTGVIKKLDIDPALKIRSGLRSWRQR